MSLAVVFLLAIVVASYRQTLFAYPSGGGSYIVSRENLGEYPSLVAGASLLVDYVLTVAVSISAGVAAIISLPAFRGLADHRVALGLGFIALLTAANLRGLKESGRIFAAPTYLYIMTLAILLAVGLGRSFFGHIDPVPFDPEAFEGTLKAGGYPRPVPHPAGVLVRGRGPDRRRGDLQRRAGLPPARVEERRHHHDDDGRPAGLAVPRRVGPGPPAPARSRATTRR